MYTSCTISLHKQYTSRASPYPGKITFRWSRSKGSPRNYIYILPTHTHTFEGIWGRDDMAPETKNKRNGLEIKPYPHLPSGRNDPQNALSMRSNTSEQATRQFPNQSTQACNKTGARPAWASELSTVHMCHADDLGEGLNGPQIRHRPHMHPNAHYPRIRRKPERDARA